jgi:hypothetical protein
LERKYLSYFLCPFPEFIPSPSQGEGEGGVIQKSPPCIPPLQRGGKIKEAREGWEATNLIFHILSGGIFFIYKFFRQIFIIPKISPYPSLKKRGEFFITFPSPSQGEGEGGVIQKSPPCVPPLQRGGED